MQDIALAIRQDGANLHVLSDLLQRGLEKLPVGCTVLNCVEKPDGASSGLSCDLQVMLNITGLKNSLHSSPVVLGHSLQDISTGSMAFRS